MSNMEDTIKFHLWNNHEYYAKKSVDGEVIFETGIADASMREYLPKTIEVNGPFGKQKVTMKYIVFSIKDGRLDYTK